MTLIGVLLIHIGPLKKDEELDEVLEKYEDQGSIVIEIIRVCGVSSSEETTYGGDKSPENVPRKVVKETGCYTKTRSNNSVGYATNTYQDLASMSLRRMNLPTFSLDTMRRKLQPASASSTEQSVGHIFSF